MPNIKGNKPLNSNSYTKTYKEDLTMARYHVFDNVRKWLQSLSFRTGQSSSAWPRPAILGVEGYQRLKDWLKRKKRQPRL